MHWPNCDVDLWILIWEELHREFMMVEVSSTQERTFPRRTCSTCRSTEGSEQADEEAEEGAMMDGGVLARVGATLCSRRERRFTKHYHVLLPVFGG